MNSAIFHFQSYERRGCRRRIEWLTAIKTPGLAPTSLTQAPLTEVALADIAVRMPKWEDRM